MSASNGLVGVVACSKSKQVVTAPAGELYTGRTFKVACSLLRAMGCERLVILSALHGPVLEDTPLAPYEFTLYGLGVAAVRSWCATARPRLASMLGGSKGLAIVPGAYAGALTDLPVERLYAGLPQGRLYSALVRARLAFPP